MNFSTFFVDQESQHLDEQSSGTEFLNQNEALGNHHLDNNDSIDIHGDECSSTLDGLLFLQEDLDLQRFDLNSNLIIE